MYVKCLCIRTRTSASLVSNAMSSSAASSYKAESPSGSSREKTVTKRVFSASTAYSSDVKWTVLCITCYEFFSFTSICQINLQKLYCYQGRNLGLEDSAQTERPTWTYYIKDHQRKYTATCTQMQMYNMQIQEILAGITFGGWVPNQDIGGYGC